MKEGSIDCPATWYDMSRGDGELKNIDELTSKTMVRAVMASFLQYLSRDLSAGVSRRTFSPTRPVPTTFFSAPTPHTWPHTMSAVATSTLRSARRSAVSCRWAEGCCCVCTRGCMRWRRRAGALFVMIGLRVRLPTVAMDARMTAASCTVSGEFAGWRRRMRAVRVGVSAASCTFFQVLPMTEFLSCLSAGRSIVGETIQHTKERCCSHFRPFFFRAMGQTN